ncbi:MAG: radical SAM protein [Planctomycetaceae bacterium]|nr:radical SAM protein [Planctomycetaceae bacterium]
MTNLCDLHCPFCYAPKHSASLGFEQVVRWSQELDKNGALGVGFGGGEPTLYPKFAELCGLLATTTGLAITFTTHSHRFTPKLRNELMGNVHFIRVSMDGVGETYERIRRRSFNQLFNQLQIVRDTCAFGINYVVNDITIRDLNEAADLAFGAGAAELLLLPEHSAHGLDLSTEQRLTKWLAENNGRFRLSISEAGVTDGLPIADPFVNEKGTKAYVHVNASGRVARTSYNQDNTILISSDEGILAAIAELEGECS